MWRGQAHLLEAVCDLVSEVKAAQELAPALTNMIEDCDVIACARVGDAGFGVVGGRFPRGDSGTRSRRLCASAQPSTHP